MSKKLNNEVLNNVSGGCGKDTQTDDTSYVTPEFTYTCNNPNCKKKFTSSNKIVKDNKVYCPYCKQYVCEYIHD